MKEAANTRQTPQEPEKRASTLTPREKEIISLVVLGKTNTQIAGQLSTSKHTVKHQLTRIYYKLGVRSRSQLVLFAIQNQVVQLHRKAPARVAENPSVPFTR